MIKVKYKVFRIIFIILIIVLLVLATYFVFKGFTLEEKPLIDDNSSTSVPIINVEEIIGNVKSENSNLIYESTQIEEFTSLAFLENDRVKTYFIDEDTGEELSIEDLIKEGKLEDFKNKEL